MSRFLRFFFSNGASSDNHVDLAELGDEEGVDLLFGHVPHGLVVDSEDFIFSLDKESYAFATAWSS